MRNFLCIILCLLAICSCDNSKLDQNTSLNESTFKKNISDLTLRTIEADTLDFYGADYSPIFLKIPFAVDTAYFKAAKCGNEPKCRIYKNIENSIEMSVCQFWSQTVIGDLDNEIDTNVYVKYLRLIKSTYEGLTNHEYIDRFLTVNKHGDMWISDGFEVLSEFEKSSTLISAFYNEFDTNYSQLGTFVRVKFLKSQVNRPRSIEYVKFICRNSGL